MTSKLAKNQFVGHGPVQYAIGDSASNKGDVIAVKVDWAEAPVPQHYFVCDYFYVLNLDASVLLAFGKLDNIKKKDKLRTKLEINFPSFSFVHQLWNTSREFHKKIAKLVEDRGFNVPDAGDPNIAAEKVQTIHSNNSLMVLSGEESTVDFYYLSPRDLYFKTRKKKDLELEPLARIILNPPLLLSFLNSCESIAESLAPKYENDGVDHEGLESD